MRIDAVSLCIVNMCGRIDKSDWDNLTMILFFRYNTTSSRLSVDINISKKECYLMKKCVLFFVPLIGLSVILFSAGMIGVGMYLAGISISVSFDTCLLFAGSIFGGLVTLSAVYISYNQNQTMHDEMRYDAAEERRKSMMPFLTLQIESINLRERYGALEMNSPTVEVIFREAFGVDICLRIDAGDCTRPLKPLLNEKYLKECLEQYVHKGPAYYHRLITIKNIGEGTAHSISVTVQNEPFHNGWSLAKNETLRYLGDIHVTHGGDARINYPIEFTMEYSDIAGRRYRQNISCEMNMNEYIMVNPPKIGVPELVEND